MVVATLRLFPSHDERRHLLAILRLVQGPTQAQPHCQSCRVYEEDDFEEALLYVERWDSEPEFERHVRSELYRRILTAVEFSQKPPEIVFDYVSATKGIELIEALRNQQDQAQAAL